MKADRFLLALIALWLATTSLAGRDWGDPSGFFDDEKIETRELQPGLVWTAASGEFNGQPMRTHILSADLRQGNFALQALMGERFANAGSGQFFRRSRTTELLRDSDALAAINVAFFDIRATQAPYGLHVRDGLVVREPASGRPNFIYLPDGRAALAELGWKAEVRVDSSRQSLTGVNRPDLRDNELVLYLPPWSRSPGKTANFTNELSLTEIVVEKTGFQAASDPSDQARLRGRVVDIRHDQASVQIEENQFVLTAAGRARSLFQNLRRETEIEVNWRLTNTPAGVEWHTIREVVSAGPVLVRSGKNLSSDAVRHPRSAAAISEDGGRVLLVLVEGRSRESAGIGLADLADYLIHLGAHDAVNFDGGGSSALAANVDGRVRLFSTPSDGNERYVPTGLGIFSSAIKLDRPRIWTGANGRQMSGLLQEYHAETEQVTLILNGRRFTIPLSSLSAADQEIIRRAKVD